MHFTLLIASLDRDTVCAQSGTNLDYHATGCLVTMQLHDVNTMVQQRELTFAPGRMEMCFGSWSPLSCS